MYRLAATNGQATNELRIRAIFACSLAFAVALIVAAFVSVGHVAGTLSDVALIDAASMIEAQRLRISAEVQGRKARSFLLTGDARARAASEAAGQEFSRRLDAFRPSATLPSERALLERAADAHRDYAATLEAVSAMRSHASTDALRDSFEADVVPAREELDRAIVDLAAMQEQQLLRATRRAKDTVSSSLGLLGVFAGVGVAASMVFGMYLTRALSALGAQRAETERQLQRVNEVNADLDAFAGRVAHDLRNLISPLSLVAELMRDSTHSEPQVKPLAARLERTVDRSITMLDGLLAFSRSSKPGPGVACSVRPVLADVIDQLAPLARKVDAQVEIEAENVKVSCSRELLHVLASNLIGNALKFIDVRPRRVVKVAATAVGSSCELSVSDTGPGIPAAALDRIFEPFYRVPGSRAGGTGIGLATVQRIVAAHGGRITVKSFVDQGTTFRVELPLAAEAPAGS